MTIIALETRIAVPAMRVFLLSLSVDVHKASTKQTNEEAIAGVTSGLMGPGDFVTWRARHFGLRLTQTSVISRYQAPDCFVDRMTQSAFRTFEYLHEFSCVSTHSTVMRDELLFSSPLGPLGAIVDRLLLKAYVTQFLEARNALIQTVAESANWTEYIPVDLRSSCT